MAPIIGKLQKLIAHERSARAIGNTQEAEAFAQRIATMLTEHKLSMTEVEFEAQDTFDPIGDSNSPALTGKLEQWLHLLATAVATSLYCRALTLREDGKETGAFVWVGRASDRTAAVEMFKYLASLGQQFAKGRTAEMAQSPKLVDLYRAAAHNKKAKAQIDRQARTLFRDWTKDFLFGYAAALHQRLTINRQHLEAASSGTGLILRDQQAIEQFVADSFVTSSAPGRQVKTKYDGALAEGWQTGQQVSLRARTALGTGA